MSYKIYLAGPITGLTYGGAQDWRDYAAAQLDSDKIQTLSPLRGKQFLKEHGQLHANDYNNPLTTSKAINRRDYFDCTRSDVVLVNLRGAERVSIGTAMEIAWCFQAQIPTVVVMEKGNLHEHCMIEDSITYRVDTLEEAIAVTKVLLGT